MTGVTGSSHLFNAYAAQQRQRPGGEEMLSKIMGETDSNEDGTISSDEIAALGDERKSAFLQNADSDGDGNVTETELTEMLSQKMQQMMPRGGMMPPPPSSDEMVSKIMEASDSDEDGTISSEEIAALDERQQAMLTDADADSDGAVSKDELSTLLQNSQPPSLNDFKQQLADAADSTEGQSTKETITDYLSDLGASSEQIDEFMQLLQGARFDIRA